jgi:Two component regulator propeller
LRVHGLRHLALVAALIPGSSTLVGAEEPKLITPRPIELPRKSVGAGWVEWESLADIHGMVSYRERITSAARGTGETIWIGTSHGRLLSFDGGRWTLQAELARLQITGIAVESDKTVWLATSDGISRLDAADGKWKLTGFREYYEGHPSFVSGGYIPAEDAVRVWGYVDDIYAPPKIRTYSPMVVSREHGLFCWGGYGTVWHHFLPHYSGANSSWLDLRDLIPHRRPTCITEDMQGNLWVGTEGDGIVRFNAAGREKPKRDPEHNQMDGTEFTHILGGDVGWAFERAVAVSPGIGKGVWCVLEDRQKRTAVAKWEDGQWKVLPMPEKLASASTVLEVAPGRVLVGIGDEPSEVQAGLVELEMASGSIKRLEGPEHKIRKIVVTPSGRVFAASWWGLYQQTAGSSR